MKILKHTHFLFILFLPAFIFGQSISGNMNSGNIAALGYGNVDIYKGDEKIASILTDAMGNFNIKLDTGYYRLELKYAGHESFVKNIHVTGDEEEDFSLSKKAGYIAPKYIEHSSPSSADYLKSEDSYGVSSGRYTPLSSYSKISYLGKGVGFKMSGEKKETAEKPGQLTAGEVNDFAKWDMWQDIVENELSIYQSEWDLFFSERYTVQVTNENGFPIINAVVQLLDKDKNVSFESRTDNTGKAELWGKFSLKDQWSGRASAQVFYNKESYLIPSLTPFKEGVNILKITAKCEQSKTVDIAFVVDATGSMQDEIDYLKAELNDVIFRTKNDFPELTFNFGNVFYRDHGDAYLTRRQDFTDVLSSAIDFISNQSAGGGGDEEEAVEVALNEALDSLSWSEDTRTKIIFLVLDASPHNNPEIRQKLKDIVRKAAAKGVRIVPITSSGIYKNTEYLMRTLALGTNGTYLFLTNHSGIGNSHIEPSTDEYKVESLNDLLIRVIKTFTFAPDCNDEDNYSEITTPGQSDSLVSFNWEVYPNPTRGEVNIKVEANVKELFITDITGKILIRFTDIEKDRVLKTNLLQYPKGIYLVTFQHESKIYTKKLIRN